MKKKVLRISYRIVSFTIAIFLFAEFLFPFACMNVFAADTATSYDNTNIEDDLTGIDLTKYPKRSTGSPELITMTEYCYSVHSSYSGFYNLYFYVYNPTGKPIDVYPENNVVNISGWIILRISCFINSSFRAPRECSTLSMPKCLQTNRVHTR